MRMGFFLFGRRSGPHPHEGEVYTGGERGARGRIMPKVMHDRIELGLPLGRNGYAA